VPVENDHFPDVDFREIMEWVTPVTESNRQTDAVVGGYAGNEPGMDWEYGDPRLCTSVYAALTRGGSNQRGISPPTSV
jgi:hypothetical protein